MSINTQTLLEAKAYKFGAATGSTDFNTLFINAVNYALTDIETQCLVDTTLISDVNTDIDLDQKYEPCLSFGIDFYLQQSHLFTVQDFGDVAGLYEQAKRWARHATLVDTDLTPRFGNVEDEDGAAD